MQPTSGWTDLNSGAALDPGFVTQLINRQLPGQTNVTGKLRVVDATLQPVAMGIETADPSSLSTLVTTDAASIRHDATQPIMRQIDFTLADPALFSLADLGFNPYLHLVQAAQRFDYGTISVEFPLGTYKVDAPKVHMSNQGYRAFTLSGNDLSRFLSIKFWSDYSVLATDYTAAKGGQIQAVLDLLTADSVFTSAGGKGRTPQGNDHIGPAWPASRIASDLSGNQPVIVPNLFRRGTLQLPAVNQLLTALNYWPVSINNRTVLQIARAPNWLVAMPPRSWDYSTSGSSMLGPTIEQEFSNDTRGYNAVKVIGGSAAASGGTEYVSTQFNADPTSVFAWPSVKNLSGGPRMIPEVIEDSSIQTQEQANLYAKSLIAWGNAVKELTTLITLSNPLTEAFEFYQANVVMRDGRTVIFSDASHLYVELGWTMDWMNPAGLMSHSLTRAAAV